MVRSPALTSNATTGERPWSLRLIGVVGWMLLAAGAVVLLYLVYSLLFTNVAAERAQDELRSQWQTPDDRGVVVAAADGPSEPPSGGADPVAAGGGGVALIEFARPGTDEPLVHDDPLVVLDDVSVADLQQGPGHYPGTALPGRPGNFAVAGHRTTYGAPFFHLDVLRPGDEVLVTDRRGRRFTYRVAGQQVVAPSATWVIDDDPLRTGRPTLTLTTCNPRFSAAQRLVVHAELVT
ncbi:MAG TPA: class E sortase [Euzebyales bacterium]